ncbi:protein YIPF6-like [Hippocampus zosterae]|uniref:protein YIPF6-like n=1 Tax=Hippocampus zosterae TaxID=109293 RepID=UPI00223CB35C|nr:protein YIPF6-like [Hippocampus zosterae]
MNKEFQKQESIYAKGRESLIAPKDDFVNSLDESACESLVGFDAGDLAPELRNWDLWGPILISMVLGLMLSIVGSATSDNFGIIFMTMMIGTSVITLNFKILGSKLRFFQTMSFLGYCVTPLVVGVLVMVVLKSASVNSLLLNMLVMTLSCVWGVLAANGFLSTMIEPDRKLIAMYPVLLFYALLSSYLIYI